MRLRTIIQYQCFGSMSRPVNIPVVLGRASQGTAGPTANLDGALPLVLGTMQEPRFHRSATTRPNGHTAR
jgi:hypothetical protein